MGELLDFIKNKRNLLNLLILGILILALYLFITFRQQQIIKSRAAADPVVFVAGDNVSQKTDGTWVAKKPQVPIKFTSPSQLGPPGVTCVIKGPATAKTGDTVNYTATATGVDKNIKMVDIYVRRPGTTGLTASDFVQIGNNGTCDSITCSVAGTYTFYTAGTPIVHCNAYYQTQYTGNKADECTGNKPGVDKAGSGWSDCGPESRMPVTVTGNNIPEPTPLPTPAPATFSCTVTGSTTAATGTQVAFSATATGAGNKLIKMVDIYVQKPNTSGTTGADFDKVASNVACNASACSVSGKYTFNEAYNAKVHCNAYYQAQYTGIPADECTGNPNGSPDRWSDCGSSSRITVAVTGNTISPPPSPSPSPAALSCTVTGPAAVVGQPANFNATATGAGKNVRMVDIYVQKPNTPGTTGADFVQIANNVSCNALTCSVSGTHTFDTAYNAPIHCNAYYQTQYTGIPADECSGNPKRGSGWSDCGSSSRITVGVAPYN